jgi:hypothetical protein
LPVGMLLAPGLTASALGFLVPARWPTMGEKTVMAVQSRGAATADQAPRAAWERSATARASTFGPARMTRPTTSGIPSWARAGQPRQRDGSRPKRTDRTCTSTSSSSRVFSG